MLLISLKIMLSHFHHCISGMLHILELDLPPQELANRHYFSFFSQFRQLNALQFRSCRIETILAYEWISLLFFMFNKLINFPHRLLISLECLLIFFRHVRHVILEACVPILIELSVSRFKEFDSRFLLWIAFTIKIINAITKLFESFILQIGWFFN